MRTAALVCLALLVACGNDKQEKKNATTEGGTESAKTPVAGQPLDLKTFELGPYLAAALTGAGEKQASLEFGYIDVRQKKGTSGDDLYDYRWRQASLIASNSHLPAAPTLGTCADVSTALVKAGEPFATEASVSGAATGAMTKGADNVFRFEDKSQDSKIDTLKTLTATFAGTTLASPKLPTAGSVQMSGAFDGSINVNTSIKDLNDNLKKFASKDLTLADVGNGKEYDLIVVTFYGGAAAATKMVRCAIAPAGTAPLTAALHKALSPIRGVFSFFANVEVKSEGGITTWTSGIAGTGVDDFTVP